MTMKIIECMGDGRARGRAHGEEARDLVRAALHRWEEAVLSPSKMPVERYVSNFLSRTGFVATLSSLLPDLLMEMHGIAEGARVPADHIVAYNFMDEQWWYGLENAATIELGCSVIGVAGSKSANRPTLLAQNMDLPGFMDGSQLALRIRAPGEPEALVFTSAGLIGLTGINCAGVAICVNTLLMLKHAPTGLPVAAVFRGALRHERLDGAATFLQSVPHASGQHYAIGSSEGIVGLECSAAGVVISSQIGRPNLTHTNHPLASDDIDSTIFKRLDDRGRIRNSKRRLNFLNERIGTLGDPSDARRILADRSVPICVVPTPERSTQTFGSVLFELTEPPQASFCLGLPTIDKWSVLSWTANHQRPENVH